MNNLPASFKEAQALHGHAIADHVASIQRLARSHLRLAELYGAQALYYSTREDLGDVAERGRAYSLMLQDQHSLEAAKLLAQKR